MTTELTTIACRFHGSSTLYTYLAVRGVFQPGDIAVVPARDWYAVVHVEEVHPEPRIPGGFDLRTALIRLNKDLLQEN